MTKLARARAGGLLTAAALICGACTAPAGGDPSTDEIQIIDAGAPRPGSPLPVIYVLDAESNLKAVEGVVSVLQRAELMPAVVIVGVPSANRDYDYTPTVSDELQGESGGAAQHLAYLLDVVRPYVQARRDVSGFQVLHGHSLSGLFALYAAKERPDVFNGVIAVGPSLWWDEGVVADWYEEGCPTGGYRRLVVALSQEVESRPPTERVVAACRRSGGPMLRTEFLEYPDEDHVTSVIPATHAGLKVVFDAWDMETLAVERDVDGLEARIDLLAEITGGAPYVNVTSIAQLARVLTREGDADAAVRLLRRADRLAPENIMVLNFLGEAQAANGDFAEACAVFQRSLTVALRDGSPMISWIEDRMKEVDARAPCPAEGF